MVNKNYSDNETNHLTNCDSSVFSGKIISIEDARKIYEMAEKNEILSHYTFPKKPGPDGIYRIWVNDNTKKNGRRQLSSKSLDKLKDKVYEHEKRIINSTRKTFADVFELVESNKLKYVKGDKVSSRINTVNRDRQFYARYFSGTSFEKKFIDDISKKDIEAVVYNNLMKYNLKKKAFYSLRGLIKSVFQLAYEEFLIKDNPFLRANFDQFESMLTDDTNIKNRVHTEEELRMILDEIRRHEAAKPTYMPAYALEMQILIGCRPGEVTPLRKSDVSDYTVEIVREQLNVKNFQDIPNHNVIVERTKTNVCRVIPRFDALNKFLDRLYSALDRYYPDSKVLFPNPGSDTGVISGYALYEYYRRVCRKLGIKLCREYIKGTHSFRRNATTDIINLSNGNAELESKLIGHSPEVARKHYFTGIDMQNAITVLNQRKLS